MTNSCLEMGNPSELAEASQASGCKYSGLWSRAVQLACTTLYWCCSVRSSSVVSGPGIRWEWLELSCQALANWFGVRGVDKQEAPTVIPPGVALSPFISKHSQSMATPHGPAPSTAEGPPNEACSWRGLGCLALPCGSLPLHWPGSFPFL